MTKRIKSYETVLEQWLYKLSESRPWLCFLLLFFCVPLLTVLSVCVCALLLAVILLPLLG